MAYLQWTIIKILCPSCWTLQCLCFINNLHYVQCFVPVFYRLQGKLLWLPLYWLPEDLPFLPGLPLLIHFPPLPLDSSPLLSSISHLLFCSLPSSVLFMCFSKLIWSHSHRGYNQKQWNVVLNVWKGHGSHKSLNLARTSSQVHSSNETCLMPCFKKEKNIQLPSVSVC